MMKRLGNFLILIGLLSLVIFFTSHTFVLDAGWFFLGGLGCTALGLLIRRGRKKKNTKRGKKPRRRQPDGEDDEID